MTDEKADLEQLLLSAGWLRFEHALTQYWNDQLDAHLESALDDRDDSTAANRMRQIVSAKKAIRQALSWPKERLARLKQPETATTLSRGGYDLTPHR